MSENHEEVTWTTKASVYLGMAESSVLVLIGIALVLVAGLLLYSSMHDLWEATAGGPKSIEHKSIEILNTDDVCYGGSGVLNPGPIVIEEEPMNDLDRSIVLTLPPLGVTIIAPMDEATGGESTTALDSESHHD